MVKGTTGSGQRRGCQGYIKDRGKVFSLECDAPDCPVRQRRTILGTRMRKGAGGLPDKILKDTGLETLHDICPRSTPDQRA